MINITIITAKRCKCDRLWCNMIKDSEMMCEMCFYDIKDEKTYMENKKLMLTHPVPDSVLNAKIQTPESRNTATFRRYRSPS